MVDISTDGTGSVPTRSAFETSCRELSEDVSSGIDTVGTIGTIGTIGIIDTLLVVEQSSLETRPRGVLYWPTRRGLGTLHTTHGHVPQLFLANV